jgi:hypothetical protein
LLGVKMQLTTNILAIVLTLTGLFWGRLGSRIWVEPKPLPTGLTGSRGSSVAAMQVQDPPSSKKHPTAWVQILLSTTIAVVGFAFADSLRGYIKTNAGQSVFLGPPTVQPTVSIGIATAWLIVGGVLAAKGTGAGLRHGAISGAITTAAILLIILAHTALLEPTLEGFYGFLGDQPNHFKSTSVLMPLLLFTFMTMSLSGGFGGLLLPKLNRRKKPSKALYSDV